jgi:alpha-amylase/alpha-mannosidase (GH57 family)
MKVVLLWHMHQPYYVNPLTRMAMMPWVRLHAAKGYLDMIDLLDRVPDVKMNFNFTPVLVKQIGELARGEVTDLWAKWSRKPAADLHPDEVRRILENFFKINWEHLLQPHSRYRELLDKRGREWKESSLGDVVRLFDEQDLRDLQTWFNLGWCGHAAEKRYPLLTELKAQGRDFTESQKNAVIDIHFEILRLVLGRYRAAAERGQIELTTTPYFHPIMPLVYDTALAERCLPGRVFPSRFSAPEDVAAQLRMAQEQHEEVFGVKARGLWPSEGSISPEILPLLKEAGIEYFCTDEGNLFRSLENEGRHEDHLELFQGWRVEHGGASVNALFRERPLSDFIGFNAARNSAAMASEHLLFHLSHLAAVRPQENACVLLALDGENAWENFPDGGEAFLTGFYQGLETETSLVTSRLGDYFDEHPPRAVLNHLHTGSWINSDFDVWIGDPEENKAWEWIGLTRRYLVERVAEGGVASEDVEQAWREIYAAEGSDWFWWYGPDFTTDCDFLFDELFRTHLQNVYRRLGDSPPAYLEIPICLRENEAPYRKPSQWIQPPMTGRVESYYDWAGAGRLEVENMGGAMYQADRQARQLYFGFDEMWFYLRLDTRQKPGEVLVEWTGPSARRFWMEPSGEGWNVRAEAGADLIHYVQQSTQAQVVWGDFWVFRVPVQELGDLTKGALQFYLALMENGLQRERLPDRGVLECAAPGAAFREANWLI